MSAIGLFLVFVLAKALVLWGRSLSWSSWAPIAYLWQDVLVALVFAIVVRKSPRAALLYWLLAAYAAINIPIGVVLSTPLTLPMLRATSGTLADSILLYATIANVLKIALTVGVAWIAPRLAVRLPASIRRASFAVAIVIVVLGPTARSRVDTMGFERNVVATMALSTVPRVAARAGEARWTDPPLTAGVGDDLSHLRGLGAGRNVVLVSLESTAAQYLRMYGAHEDVTPHLERLAQSGVVFDNAYAVYPESIKGLFSILCSTSPAFDTTPRLYASAPCASIAAELGRGGYDTALFHSGRFDYLGMRSVIEGRGFGTLADAGDIGGQYESSFGVDEPATIARILAWIDARPTNRPFFLTYLPIAGHHPYETPERGPFPEREEIGRYRNALHSGDRALGALRDGLTARGLDRKTVWIVLGDHGEAMGQHEGNYGHTFFLFEENVHVPFIVSIPGAIDRPVRSRTIVSLVDTAPTVLDLVGMPAAAQHQGESALNGRARMALFFTDYSLGLLGLRDDRWKFVYELESERSKLFDLERDPHELEEVSASQGLRVDAYKRTLLGWSAAQKNYVALGR
jgi:hypothetical protein